MSWEIILHSDVDTWLGDLAKNDPGSAQQVQDAIDALQLDGPTLGRPLVDHIQGSRHHNMKELRPGSTGRTELRLSRAWQKWYRVNIPIADARYDEHLDAMREEGAK